MPATQSGDAHRVRYRNGIGKVVRDRFEYRSQASGGIVCSKMGLLTLPLVLQVISEQNQNHLQIVIRQICVPFRGDRQSRTDSLNQIKNLRRDFGRPRGELTDATANRVNKIAPFSEETTGALRPVGLCVRSTRAGQALARDFVGQLQFSLGFSRPA